MGWEREGRLINLTCPKLLLLFFKILFLDRGEGRERNLAWLPLMRPLQGTWPTTQACALTGNGTSDPLVHRPALSPLSHTSQGTCPKFLSKWNKIRYIPSEWWILIVGPGQIHYHFKFLLNKPSDHFSRNIYRTSTTCLGIDGLMILKTLSTSDLTGQA